MKFISFLFPIVGWIYWRSKKDSDPKAAEECLHWAMAGVAAGVLLEII